MAFKKGASGNPSGRPKGSKDWRSSFTLEVLEEIKPNARELLLQMVQEALGGNKFSRKTIVDLMFVKPTQSIEVTDENGLKPDTSWMTDDMIKAMFLLKEGKAKVVLIEDS